MTQKTFQVVQGEWIAFLGGELEGKRPKTLCPVCREQSASRDVSTEMRRRERCEATAKTLCFQCYRADLDRERALRADRWQWLLPLEPVNRARLEMLKAERMAARAMGQSADRFVERRRQAQIAARRELQRIASGLAASRLASGDRERKMASAIHAAELQLPESWLPFVVSR